MENTNDLLHSGSGKAIARRARDKEFVETYNAALAKLVNTNLSNPRRAAVKWTVFNGAPHYHVSYERAYKVVCHILRHNASPVKPSLQTAMWMEIAQRVKELMAGSTLSVAQALELVLTHCRASRFFISEHYAYANLLPRARKERRRAMMRTIASR